MSAVRSGPLPFEFEQYIGTGYTVWCINLMREDIYSPAAWVDDLMKNRGGEYEWLVRAGSKQVHGRSDRLEDALRDCLAAYQSAVNSARDPTSNTLTTDGK